MSIVKGEQLTASINGELIACWRSSTLEVTTDIIAKSTVGSGNWKEFEGNVLSWTVNGEGLLYNNEDFTIHDVYALQVALTNVFLVFTVLDVYYYGEAIITSIQEQGNVNDNASFNISLQGTGELAFDTSNEDLRFGNYPADFAITNESVDDPVPGVNTLTLSWSEADPVPTRYTVHIVNLDTLDDAFIVVDGLSTNEVAVVPGVHFSFTIRSDYFFDTAHSEYSPAILYS